MAGMTRASLLPTYPARSKDVVSMAAAAAGSGAAPAYTPPNDLLCLSCSAPGCTSLLLCLMRILPPTPFTSSASFAPPRYSPATISSAGFAHLSPHRNAPLFHKKCSCKNK
eukprot:TRINITY_DN1703_c0_g1_i1.p2 TRINITY_DN1703_c0_g1~~TRINITY_DN1703_c0_g1_i1.p2  ORF type:complete len:111 (+),score=10.30 TRINITY_DN1703_c0_g1_i1:402-734(+)